MEVTYDGQDILDLLRAIRAGISRFPRAGFRNDKCDRVIQIEAASGFQCATRDAEFIIVSRQIGDNGAAGLFD